MASARRHIEVSGQDLLGPCPLFTRYDVRLFDILAAKLASGVKVRIVVRDPANHFPPGGYSSMRSLGDLSDVLLDRLRLRTGGHASARAAFHIGSENLYPLAGHRHRRLREGHLSPLSARRASRGRSLLWPECAQRTISAGGTGAYLS
ncbi:hypothetical protein [Nocardia wallacei]|uniref:hypothetical protein n=1 Tax=Nocardia wallacei TaxID=480035 RepID=UPI0024578CDF|nr:hypothetical protein [Nocardia wallacei]